MFSSKNREDVPAEELTIFVDDEYDPVLIQFRKLEQLARRSSERRVVVKTPESLPDSTPLLASSLVHVPDEHDPFMIKLQKLKKLARESCDWRIETPRDSSESADPDTSSPFPESRSSFSSITSEATVYGKFTTEDEAKASKSSEATATIGWQTSPQAKRDEYIPAFCQPIPTTQWLGRPWRDGCHPSVHRQQ